LRADFAVLVDDLFGSVEDVFDGGAVGADDGDPDGGCVPEVVVVGLGDRSVKIATETLDQGAEHATLFL
jgi:hypothetical protein